MTDREVVLATDSTARPRGRVRQFVANRSTPQRLGVVGAALVLLLAPFGGLKSQAEADVRPLALDQRIDIGPFYVTITKVSQVSDLQPAISPTEGNKLLVITVEVTNHTDRAEFSNLVRDAFGGDHTGVVPWEDVDGSKPQVFNVDDAGRFSEYVNPGQTYTLALVLQQKPDTDLDQLTLSVYGYFFQEVDPQTLDPKPLGPRADPAGRGPRADHRGGGVRGRRTAGAFAILAAVALGQVVTSRVPIVASDNPTFVENGKIGDPVGLSYADVEVTDVRPAHYLAPPAEDELVRMAGGVWVLVSVTATAVEEPVRLDTAWLMDDEGRAYRTSTRSECAIAPTLPTGLPTYLLYCFDVPTDRLEGLHFRLARGDLGTGRIDGDALADVDLAVSGGDVTTWATTTAAYAAETSSLEPFELRAVTITETGP